MQRPSNGPSPFEVSLNSYSLHPWTSRNADVSQWFNYGLTPTTWTEYAVQQTRLWKASLAAAKQDDVHRAETNAPR